MTCDGSSEKEIIQLKSVLLPHHTEHQVKQKTTVKIYLLCRVKYCLQYIR